MASKLSGNDIQNIASQGAVRSSPLRNNFTALKNKINEVIDALAAAAIGTTNAETTAARPYHTSLGDRLDSIWKGQYNFVKSGGVVSLNSNPQKVDISSGEAKVDGADVKWSSSTSGTIAYTVSNTRYDVVVANSDSTISIVTGTAHATPKFPSLATSQKALAVLLVTTSAVSIFYQMASVMDRDLFDGNHYNTTAVTPYGFKRKQIFTANGTWTRPIGIQKVHVTCVGAGGAGGNGATAGAGGSGGGGGGGAGGSIKTFFDVTTDVSVTVGATGNTSFGSLIAYAGDNGVSGGAASAVGVDGGAGSDANGLSGFSLTGGAGGNGAAGTAGGYGAGGGGGGGSGSAYAGGAGGPGYSSLGGAGGTQGYLVRGSGGGGGGAGGDFGAGGAGGNGGTSGAGANGSAGAGYGSGGGGGGGEGSTGGAGTGGAGGPGICIVEWEE